MTAVSWDVIPAPAHVIQLAAVQFTPAHDKESIVKNQ
jgi:hypothetical protein